MSIEDPVGFLVTGLFHLGRGIGILVGDGIHALIGGMAKKQNSGKRVSRKELEVQRQEKDETRRMAGCRQVVTDYIEALGFIARECISRDELEELIDNGIEPDALA